jgi:RNA polymerase sigma factor (sigma-70 family)
VVGEVYAEGGVDLHGGEHAVTTTLTQTPPATLAVDEVFAERGARLLGAAYRLTRNRHDAEDLLQDAFSKACANPGVFRGRSANEAERWLWVVMGRAWRDRLARRGSDTVPLPEEDLESLLADEATPLVEAERDWATAVVYEALSRLGPRHRLAMIMLARGMGEVDAAEAAGVSRRTMREWRRDARRRLGLFGERLEAGEICRSLETSLSAFADGEHGPGKQLVALEAHLAHCGYCRARLAEIRRHSAALAVTLPVLAATSPADELPVDLSELVQIGEHAAAHLTRQRGLTAFAPGLLEYVEAHWRLAVVAASIPVLASAIVLHAIGTSGTTDVARLRTQSAPATTGNTATGPAARKNSTPARAATTATRAEPPGAAAAQTRTPGRTSTRRVQTRRAQSTPSSSGTARRAATSTPASSAGAGSRVATTPRRVTVSAAATPRPQVARAPEPARSGGAVQRPPCRTTACAFAP